jgi:Ankyrin repeats (3 copies)
MNSDTAKSIFVRAIAFTSTLVFSLALVNSLPSARKQRQRSFAQAAMDGNLHRMRLLHLTGANVNARGDCCVPLFLAAATGKAEAVRYLLDEGADVNARDEFGHTALTEATFNGNVAVIRELLVRGADINNVAVDGTALDLATRTNNAAAADLLKHYGGKRAGELR